MSDWCFTPEERRIRHNKATVKAFLREKFAKYTVWREKNKIKEGDMILIADMFRAYKKDDEEFYIEEFVSALFGFGQTTISAALQTFYQVIRHAKIDELSTELEN